MLNRRQFLTGLGTGAAIFSTASPAQAFGGGIRASEKGLRPGAFDDQGNLLQRILEEASSQNQPVFLEPGIYRVGNVSLPENTRLYGVKGATELRFSGGDHLFYAENNSTVDLEGLTLDGRLLPVKEYADSNLRIRNTKSVRIRDCHFTNAASSGLYIDKSSGHVAENLIDSAIGFAGMFADENHGLTISGNTVEDCGNAGIVCYRRSRGADSTIVSQNRIRRISALRGGTGPYGNGINTYQCDGIIVTSNHVSDCAFSTIRSNSCNNIQITNNTCLRAGETSIYSEFAHLGANISGNIVDGGAIGISIANMDYGGRLSVCANNLVRNLHQHIPYEDETYIHGCGIYAEADVAVTGNVIEQAERFGIALGWGPHMRNVVATANVIRKAHTGFYISVVEGIGSASITDNVISEIAEGAIIGYRWKEVATGDLARSGAADYPTLQISGNKLDS